MQDKEEVMDTENESHANSVPLPAPEPEPEPDLLVVSGTRDRSGDVRNGDDAKLLLSDRNGGVAKEQPSPRSASPVPLLVQDTESIPRHVSASPPPPPQRASYIPDQPTTNTTPLNPSTLILSSTEPPPTQMSEEHLRSTNQTSDHMFERFRKWAISNYGDSGKTKTVTKKKYQRIMRILTGEEQPTSDNSKFRFWVKNKGFRLGPPPPDEIGADDQVLYVPSRVHVSTLLIFSFSLGCLDKNMF